MFSMAQLQSCSGSELETRAIEFAVINAGIRAVKFNRENKTLGGADQIFNVRERTFFFKPRFNLAPIKDDRGVWKPVMNDVVAKTEGGAGKGVNDVETDVIEAFPPSKNYPNGYIRLYECKIGLGKPEGRAKAGESLQLIKAKRLLSHFWEDKHGGKILNPGQYPVIECFFLAWKFGEKTNGKPVVTPVPIKTTAANFDQSIDFTHHRVPFKALSNNLRSAAGEVGSNSNNRTSTLAHWDDVKPINPDGFAKLTNINSKFVESFLLHERGKIFQYFSMLAKTLSESHAFWLMANANTRKAMAQSRRFVSGAAPLTAEMPPQEPNWALNLRAKGKLANYMEKWNNKWYNHLNPNNKRRVVENNKRYFGVKAKRALNRLIQQNNGTEKFQISKNLKLIY
jgi:hypothetical protein